MNAARLVQPNAAEAPTFSIDRKESTGFASRESLEVPRDLPGSFPELNPHPAGQLQLNIPQLASGETVNGLQHKYRETVLFFPSQGQTCHAYCSFCFRWAQFIGDKTLRIATNRVWRKSAGKKSSSCASCKAGTRTGSIAPSSPASTRRRSGPTT